MSDYFKDLVARIQEAACFVEAIVAHPFTQERLSVEKRRRRSDPILGADGAPKSIASAGLGHETIMDRSGKDRGGTD